MRLRWVVLLCGFPAACTTFDAPPVALDAGSDARVVAVGEAGDAAADASDAGDAGPPGKRIFLSVSSFNGNLVKQASALQLDAGASGVAAADALCTREAKLENLGGARWVAWLGTDAPAVPLARFRDPGPRYAVTGELVLRGLGALPLRPITLPDGGSPVGGEAWTGTNNNATASNEHCLGWTSNGVDQGTFGSPAEPNRWSAAGVRTCGGFLRLICIEDERR